MKNIFSILCFAFIVTYNLEGQQNNPGFLFKGDIGLYSDFYHMQADTLNAVPPRRPSSVNRFVANANISFKNFSLPFSIIIPLEQRANIILEKPAVPKTPFIKYIRNPQNRVGIAPTYKWIQLLLGSQIPQYSELSLSDYPIFGAGLSLSPGKFRFSTFTGTSQLAIEPDTANRIAGTYARHILTAKIGFGKEEDSHVYLIGCTIKDDTNSLKAKSYNPLPQAGILGSIEYRVNFGKQFFIQGEFAGSAFTRDRRSNEIDSFDISLPKSLFTPQESSRLDIASVFKMGTNGKKFSIRLTGRYYGDGFVPLGYPFLQTDRLEITIDPRISLFNNKAQFSGSIGRRINNLSGIRAATATQTIASGNLNLVLTGQFTMTMSYSNFGFRNTLQNDTFRAQMVTQTWSINPTLNFQNDRRMHVFTLVFSQNNFKDFNIISGQLNSNNANTAVLTYLYSLIQSPFNTSISLSYFSNKTNLANILTKSVNLNVGYKFFENQLITNGGITLCANTLDQQDSGLQTLAHLGIKYLWQKKLTLAILSTINLFDFGMVRPGISYREDLIRTTLSYKI